MSAEEPAEDRAQATRPAVVLIGAGDLAEETERALEAANARIIRLCEPDEDDVREALEGGHIDSVAVVERTDAIVLRFALMGRAVSDDVPLLLTIFDDTMAEQVGEGMPNTRVTSLADIVAPSLAGPCIDERYSSVDIQDGKPMGIVERDGDLSEEPIRYPRPRRVEALARALLTPYDTSAGLLLFGAIGLAAVFTIETVTAVSSRSTRASSMPSTARRRRSSPSIPIRRSPMARVGTSSSPRRRWSWPCCSWPRSPPAS